MNESLFLFAKEVLLPHGVSTNTCSHLWMYLALTIINDKCDFCYICAGGAAATQRFHQHMLTLGAEEGAQEVETFARCVCVRV